MDICFRYCYFIAYTIVLMIYFSRVPPKALAADNILYGVNGTRCPNT
jgi:hypothetical protein